MKTAITHAQLRHLREAIALIESCVPAPQQDRLRTLLQARPLPALPFAFDPQQLDALLRSCAAADSASTLPDAALLLRLTAWQGLRDAQTLLTALEHNQLFEPCHSPSDIAALTMDCLDALGAIEQGSVDNLWPATWGASPFGA